jgi:hypothetical protein
LHRTALLNVLVRQCGRPLEYDREQELGMLEKQDTQLRAQAVRLERTTRNLEEQKRQLQKHYKETEDVGKKLDSYKGKLAAVRLLLTVALAGVLTLVIGVSRAQTKGTTLESALDAQERRKKCSIMPLSLCLERLASFLPPRPHVFAGEDGIRRQLCRLPHCACAEALETAMQDAVEVKNAENAAEILMQRLAKAQGTTISAKDQLKREKARLEKVKEELAKTRQQEV